MTEAIFGLIGVVIGGLLNGGVSFLSDRRTERANAKVAARLMYSEIESNQVAARSALTQKTIAQIKVAMSADEWLAHRGIFAGVLDDEEWSVMNAYYVVALRFIQLGAVSEFTDELGAQQSNLERLMKRGEKASVVILRYAGTIVPHHQAR